LFGDRIVRRFAGCQHRVELVYALQEDSTLPDFFSKPAERTKPYGTVHAVLCAADCINEPFAVINADDYYGASAFQMVYRELCRLPKSGMATMAGYLLKNTVSENGTVTRGVCLTEDGFLKRVVETYKIGRLPDGSICETGTDKVKKLDPDITVSMNFWGCTPWILGAMRDYFAEFLRSLGPEENKRECLLPVMMDDFIREGKLKVSVLESSDEWCGITYREDRASVMKLLAAMHTEGKYPNGLAFTDHAVRVGSHR
jgi:hypothetical protein